MEEVLLELGRKKAYLIMESEENMKSGKFTEVTTNIGSSKALEGSLPRNYVAIGNEVGIKLKPWIKKQKNNLHSF